MTKPIIEVTNLGKKYSKGSFLPYHSLRDSINNVFKPGKKKENDEFWALKDVNFKVMRGESVGIIGRNGAGKSTLLKILSQITPPTMGKVTMRGRVASLLEVGTGFHQELTGRENIYLNGAILGMSRVEINRKFKEIVEFAEIGDFLDMQVKHYSSGMYMRLAFAVAAHLESEILIVDEVLAVGDAEFQKKCLGRMDEVAKKEGRTVLFVSHNMGAIRDLCSKTIYVSNGRLLSFGQTKGVIKKYLDDSSKNVAYGLLPNFEERSGSGAVRVEKISITNKKGESSIYSFDKLRISVNLSGSKKVKKIQLKIPIIDVSSEVLFRIDTDQLDAKVLASPIIIETGEIGFTPTKCYVNIGVFADGELSDYVKSAYSFDIFKKNKIGVRSYNRDMCLLMIPHKVIGQDDKR